MGALLYLFHTLPPLRVARAAGSEQAEALQSGLDDAVDRMRALATNRGDPKRRSKQDRARLTGSFRELCSAVEVRGAGDHRTGGLYLLTMAALLWRGSIKC